MNNNGVMEMYDMNELKVGRAIPSDSAPKQSECEAAYQQLYKSQDDLSQAIAELHDRLGPVIGGGASDQSCSPSHAALSEVHGWLIAAEDRTAALVRRVRAITESLTI